MRARRHIDDGNEDEEGVVVVALSSRACSLRSRVNVANNNGTIHRVEKE